MRILILLSFMILSFMLKANPLVKAAQERLQHFVIYDGSYQAINYPMGDVASNKGVCTDVVIRSYRTIGIDLQQLVHEDMQKHFDEYPKLWGLSKPDSNIDHRRVPNLEVFFKRYGQSLPVTNNPRDYQAGDIVSWRLHGSNRPHIGIVSDVIATSGNPEIIHNIGWGPKSEDILFLHPIQGHYRF